jgi:toxin FitB
VILLDTNVLSEFMRPQPAVGVVAWLDKQPSVEVFTSAISRAEIELGILRLPAGRRQEALSRAVRVMIEEKLARRCLPFDEEAARHYARVVSARMRAGRPISVEDAQIAAIALAHRMPLATRNTADFAGIDGLAVRNPWNDGGSQANQREATDEEDA